MQGVPAGSATSPASAKHLHANTPWPQRITSLVLGSCDEAPSIQDLLRFPRGARLEKLTLKVSRTVVAEGLACFPCTQHTILCCLEGNIRIFLPACPCTNLHLLLLPCLHLAQLTHYKHIDERAALQLWRQFANHEGARDLLESVTELRMVGHASWQLRTL